MRSYFAADNKNIHFREKWPKIHCIRREQKSRCVASPFFLASSSFSSSNITNHVHGNTRMLNIIRHVGAPKVGTKDCINFGNLNVFTKYYSNLYVCVFVDGSKKTLLQLCRWLAKLPPLIPHCGIEIIITQLSLSCDCIGENAHHYYDHYYYPAYVPYKLM